MNKLKLTRSTLLVGMIFLIVVAILCSWLGLIMVNSKLLEQRELLHAGIDVMGAFVCVVLYYGCIGDGKQELAQSTRYFILMILMNSFSFLLNECGWFLHGNPSMSNFNLIVNTLKNAVDLCLIFCFWRYVRTVLELNGGLEKWTDYAAKFLLIPELILVFSNLFYPVCFGINENGIYYEGSLYWLTDIYLLVVVLLTIASLVRSRAPLRDKMAAGSFISMPILSYAITLGKTNVATHYGAILISLILMYSILFSERGKKLAATQSELGTASHIQEAMLPTIFPAFPMRKEFDLHASMDPAKEVGGDFYDFFLIDEDHLGLVMADVSGKGVPAALFMMASKIILSSHAQIGKSPAQILTDTNAAICANNKEEMFVTVWVGILEISTGKLTAANAGHEYPAIYRNGKKFDLLLDKHDLVIGAMDGVKFREYELQLEPGDKLFLYTDGVPEATNSNQELFGTDRMIDALNKNLNVTPKEVLENVKEAVNDFVKEAEQFDDLTMLCLEYKGSE